MRSSGDVFYHASEGHTWNMESRGLGIAFSEWKMKVLHAMMMCAKGIRVTQLITASNQELQGTYTP
jgi:hypothetical protein